MSLAGPEDQGAYLKSTPQTVSMEQSRMSGVLSDSHNAGVWKLLIVPLLDLLCLLHDDRSFSFLSLRVMLDGSADPFVSALKASQCHVFNVN